MSQLLGRRAGVSALLVALRASTSSLKLGTSSSFNHVLLSSLFSRTVKDDLQQRLAVLVPTLIWVVAIMAAVANRQANRLPKTSTTVVVTEGHIDRHIQIVGEEVQTLEGDPTKKLVAYG
jgi:hypothetical protein